jgi:hypothetical protein
MPFTSELNETEECTSEFRIVHVLLSSRSFGAYAQPFGLRVPFKGIQIQNAASVHETRNASKETNFFLFLQVIQHSLIQI